MKRTMRTKEVYQPDEGNPPRVREVVRDVVAVLNLRLRGDGGNATSPVHGDVSHMPLGSKETHDSAGRWLRAKSLHLIHKMIEMRV